MAPKPKKAGRYPGPGYNETGPGVPKKKPSTSYSPAPMSAAAKKKAAAAGKATAAKTAKPNKAEKLIQDITNRYRVTAREARDIVTAVGTAGVAALDRQSTNRMTEKGPVVKNLARQVKEAGVAYVTGKKGTTSDINSRRLGTGFLKGDTDTSYGYEKGKKRK